MRRVVLVMLCVLMIAGVLTGQASGAPVAPTVHVVQRGDTLWDLCDAYYGRPELWPKLWQMNPFVTNPHLLRPGDRIRLLVDVPVVESAPKVVQPREKETPEEDAGIDVSGLVQAASLGFLTLRLPEGVGYITRPKKQANLLASGEMIYVTIRPDATVSLGERLTIYQSSSMLRHPVSGKRIGHVVVPVGVVTLGVALPDRLYEARIVESYRDAHGGDLLLPWEPAPTCIAPGFHSAGLASRIVASQTQHKLVGQFSVVYLEAGSQDGVEPGQVFEIMERRQPEPARSAVEAVHLLGHLLVLSTRADTATGVVVSAAEEIPPGAPVRSPDAATALGIHARLPRCVQ